MQDNNFTHITAGIAQVIETEEKLLNSLPVEVITQRRNTQNRTIKQILGHLIDSASNNHQRMVRLQYSKDLYAIEVQAQKAGRIRYSRNFNLAEIMLDTKDNTTIASENNDQCNIHLKSTPSGNL